MNMSSEAEHRCECGKLLCKGFVRDGEIHIKCKRCGKIKKICKDTKIDGELVI